MATNLRFWDRKVDGVTGLGLMEKETVVHQKVSLFFFWGPHYSSHCEWASSLGDGAMPWDGSGSHHSLKLQKNVGWKMIKNNQPSSLVGDLIVCDARFLRKLCEAKKIQPNEKTPPCWSNFGCSLKTYQLLGWASLPSRLETWCFLLSTKGCCQFNKSSFRANSKEVA